MSRKDKLQKVGESYIQNEENQLFLTKGQENTEYRERHHFFTSSHVKFSANYKARKKPTNQIRLTISVRNRTRVRYPLRRLCIPEV